MRQFLSFFFALLFLSVAVSGSSEKRKKPKTKTLNPNSHQEFATAQFASYLIRIGSEINNNCALIYSLHVFNYIIEELIRLVPAAPEQYNIIQNNLLNSGGNFELKIITVYVFNHVNKKQKPNLELVAQTFENCKYTVDEVAFSTAINLLEDLKFHGLTSKLAIATNSLFVGNVEKQLVEIRKAMILAKIRELENVLSPDLMRHELADLLKDRNDWDVEKLAQMKHLIDALREKRDEYVYFLSVHYQDVYYLLGKSDPNHKVLLISLKPVRTASELQGTLLFQKELSFFLGCRTEAISFYESNQNFPFYEFDMRHLKELAVDKLLKGK